MGETGFKQHKELTKNALTTQTQIQTQTQVPAQPTLYAQPGTMSVQARVQTQMEDNTQLMAWAIAQNGQVAQPEITTYETYHKEKSWAKKEKTVVEEHTRETPKSLARAQALQEKMPELYAAQSIEPLAIETKREVRTIFGDTLGGTEDPGLTLLDRLSKVPDVVTPEMVEQLRTEMQAMGLQTGEERIPYEGVFENAEVVALMTANLSNHLVTRMEEADQTNSSAYEGMLSVAHTTNTYANAIVSRVTKERSKLIDAKRGEIEVRRREALNAEARRVEEEAARAAEHVRKLKEEEEKALRQMAAKKQHEEEEARRKAAEEAVANRALVDNRRRERNLARIATEIAQANTKGLDGLLTEGELADLQGEVAEHLGHEAMKMDFKEGGAEVTAFVAAIKAGLSECETFVTATARRMEEPQKIEDFLLNNRIPEAQLGVYNDERELRLALREGEEAAQKWLTPIKKAVETNYGYALAHVVDCRNDLTPEQQKKLVQVKMDLSPKLFSTGSQTDITTQMGLFLRYQQLYAPQLGAGLTQTKADNQLTQMVPLVVAVEQQEIIASLATQMRGHSTLKHFLPKEDQSAHLEKVLNQYFLEKGTPFAEMKPAEKATLAQKIFGILEAQAALVAPILQLEDPQVWVDLTEFLLAEKSLQDLQHTLIALRSKIVNPFPDLTPRGELALKIRNPLVNRGGEIPLDYHDNTYSSGLKSAERGLRGERRLGRLNKDLAELEGLTDLKLTGSWIYKGFVVDKMGSKGLNAGRKGEYEENLVAVVRHTKTNQDYLEGRLKGSSFDSALTQQILLHLGPQAASEEKLKFERTVDETLLALSPNSADAVKVAQMDALRQARIQGLKRNFPTLNARESDLRKVLERDDVQMHLYTPGEGQWLDFITPILNNAVSVLTYIDKHYSSMKWLPDQLRLHFSKEIYSGKMTLEEGKVEFSDYHGVLSKLKLKVGMGTSVTLSGSIKKLLDKTFKENTGTPEQKVLTDYFDALISNASMGEVLRLENTWKEKQKEVAPQIQSNHRALKKFLEDKTDSAARIKGFEQFARGAVCGETVDTFKNRLPQLWADFTALENSNADLVTQSARTMQGRVDSLTAVEAMRKRAVDRQAKDHAQKERLYSVQAGKQSVFQDADEGAIDRLPKQMKQVKSMVKDLASEVTSTLPIESVSNILAEYLARRPVEELPVNAVKFGITNVGKLERTFRKTCEMVQMDVPENLLCKCITMALARYGNMLLREEGMSALQMTSMVGEAVKRETLLLREEGNLGDHVALLEMQSLTMDNKEYLEAVNATKDTVARQKALDKLLKTELSKSEWAPQAQAAIQNAWLVYRHDSTTEHWKGGEGLEHIQTLLRADLANEPLVDTLRAVGNRSILESYQAKGTMEAVSSTSATQKEQQVASTLVKTRADFESYLSSHSKESTLKAYNELTVEQRLLFAYGLSMPQKLLNLQTAATGKLLQHSSEQAADVAFHALQDYICQGKTLEMEKLDYQRAIATLEGEKAETYEVALDFVAFCTKARQETVPVDTQRMTDAQKSIQAAGRTVPKRTCTTVDQLKDYITEQTSEKHEDVGKAVQVLSEDQMTLLLVALQNRTLLDKSAIPNAEHVVDQDQRDELVELFSNNYAEALMGQAPSALLSKAVLSLQSYQVRDGIVLGDELYPADLVQTGLSRATEIDITLLKSALDMVREIEKGAMRLQAIRSASKVIDRSKNTLAKDSYAINKDSVTTEDQFRGYIKAQINGSLDGDKGTGTLNDDNSEAVGLFAAYQSLSDEQLDLFFKALANRDVLDISKRDIMANRFGILERDYVNQTGRNSLLDEFANAGKVVVGNDVVSQAFAGILSTQVDDTVDFTQNQDVVQAQTSSRSTTVDWKLFKRGIQLVRRATDEEKLRQNHFELYAGSGAVHKRGAFQFKSDFLRHNLHNAGNRFTRFLGRRVATNAQDSLSDYLGDTLSEKAVEWAAQKMVGSEDLTLSAKEEVKLAPAKQLEYSQDFRDVVRQARESSAMIEGKTTLKGVAKDVASIALGEFSEELGLAKDVAGHVEALFEGVMTYRKLNRTLEESKGLSEGDKAIMDAAHTRQTEAEKKRYDKAAAQLDTMMRETVELDKSRQVDKGISAVGETLNDIGGSDILEDIPMAETVGRVAREAAELINFARSAFNEKALVDKHLDAKAYWENRRTGLSAVLPQTTGREVDTYSFALAASGFENMTEYATAKGMEFVQSLLFAASKYNTLPSTKLLAETVLETLGFTQIGKDYDTLNAKAVFDRLMGMNR